MEPPLRVTPKTKSLSAREIRALLQRISKLPLELSLPILRQLDYDSLDAVCRGLGDERQAATKSGQTKASTVQLENLGSFCSDVNFWHDYLLEQGYDLPEGLPVLIQMIKLRGETDLDVLKALFFTNKKQIQDRERVFLHNMPKFNPKEVEQATLDLDYLIMQISNERERNGLPRRFDIHLHISRDQVLPNLPDSISVDELVEWINSNIETYGLSWGSGLMHSEDVFSYYSLLGRSLREQSLAVLPLLLREGDWIEIKFLDESGRYRDNQFYYIGPRGQLVKKYMQSS